VLSALSSLVFERTQSPRSLNHGEYRNRVPDSDFSLLRKSIWRWDWSGVGVRVGVELCSTPYIGLSFCKRERSEDWYLTTIFTAVIAILLVAVPITVSLQFTAEMGAAVPMLLL
jgi:hypothetical protein